MGWELCQVLYRSTSVPTRDLGEERRTFPKKTHRPKWLSTLEDEQAPPHPALTVTAAMVLQGNHQEWSLSLQGVQAPPKMGKRSTKLTSLPHFIHDCSRSRCWILVHFFFLIACSIIHIMSTWDQSNKMGTDVDTDFLFCKTSIVFELSWLFFKIENQTLLKTFCLPFSRWRVWGNFADFFVSQDFHKKSGELYQKKAYF